MRSDLILTVRIQIPAKNLSIPRKTHAWLITTNLRNCAKFKLQKNGIGKFCTKWLLLNWCATKEKFCVLFPKNFVNENPNLNVFFFVYMYTKTVFCLWNYIPIPGFCLFTCIPKLVSVCLHVYLNWFLLVCMYT